MIDLNQFPLPEVASEAFRKMNLQTVALGDGINRHMSGHDKGVTFRFFRHAEYNEFQSKLKGYEVFDEDDHIEWRPDDYQKPTERVRLLPPELLRLDEEGNCVGGRYQEAYERYKTGLQTAGLLLTKWGVLTDGQILTLAMNGVFSVEQFAAMPTNKVRSKFPGEIQEAFERAILYVNGKDAREASAETVAKMKQLEEQLAEKDGAIQALQEQFATFMAGEGEEEKVPKARKARGNKESKESVDG